MKKTCYLLFCLTLVFSLIYLCYLGFSRESDIEVYTVKEARSYLYKQSEELSLEVYSNKEDLLIEYVSSNTYNLHLNSDIKINMLNVSVDKTIINDYYLYTINYYLPSLEYNELFEDVILEINNSKYTLKINVGAMKIINEEYTLLSFNQLYASYSYINNEFYLTGINLEINKEFHKINKLVLADTAYGRLDLITNSFKNNEINIKREIPNYIFNRVLDLEYTYNNSNILFIPIVYKNPYLIRNVVIEIYLDNTKYIIDSPIFIANSLDLNTFNTIKTKGEIIYA